MRAWTEVEVVELRRLHGQGCSWSEIARRLDRPLSTVWLKGRHDLGLSSHQGRGRCGPSPNPVNPKRVHAAVQMRREGMSYGRIAAELGCTRQAVQQLLARWSIAESTILENRKLP